MSDTDFDCDMWQDEGPEDYEPSPYNGDDADGCTPGEELDADLDEEAEAACEEARLAGLDDHDTIDDADTDLDDREPASGR